MNPSDSDRFAELRVRDDELVITGSGLVGDRNARLFFRSVYGAAQTVDGFRCQRRRLPMSVLTIRVFDWLEKHGYTVLGGEGVEETVTRELERRRSFERTRTAAERLRSGETEFAFEHTESALDAFGWSEARRLRPHQRLSVAHALTGMNVANFSVPGSGKTACALAAAACHLYAKTVDLIVVVGPLACFDPWEQETYAAVGGRIPTRRVRGSARQRYETYQRTRSGELLLLSYATAAADQRALVDLFESFQVMLIVDESHRIKRFRGGVWAPALMELAHRAAVRMVLSGTPMPQSGRDLYSQLNIVWPDAQLTGSRDAFAARVDSDFPGVVHDILPFVSRTPKAALGLPPYHIERHEVALTETQAEIYDLIANRFRRQIEDGATWHDKLETLRRGRPIRLLQAACNPNLLNVGDSYYGVARLSDQTPTLMERLATYRDREVAAKSVAALELVSEIAQRHGKVVCWSNFVSNLDEFSSLVRNRLGLPCFQIDGRVPSGVDALHDDSIGEDERPGEADTREVIIHRFLDYDGPAVLVTNPASCSESISLHRSCHNAIYLDRTYDCALFLQSIDRIHRLGLPSGVQVTIHILIATVEGNPTVDQLVDAALARKTVRMQQLLEGAELAPIHLADDPAQDAEGDEEDLAALLRYLLGKTP